MRCMRVGVGCINAAAVQELVEQLFIGSLVDGLIAFGALQIACGLFEVDEHQVWWDVLAGAEAKRQCGWPEWVSSLLLVREADRVRVLVL